ncbi:MAG: alanine-tRNA synthetase second additional domain-containing protein, partial [Firmicutes bacterium]|nr:alanine-tRNA synthetase second additional domain-containing protein [Bacillota bacterium]
MAFYDSTNSHLYSVYFAPRGSVRMFELGAQIAQQHLSPFDHIIGILGESGAGKSMLIKGMFPGLELTNDDAGVNVRPLPLLNIDEENI